MQICVAHWAKIKARLELLGLGHLGAKSGEEAHAAMVEELEGGTVEPDKYDPFIACNWMIFNHAIELGGVQLLAIKEDGTHYCPLCEAWIHRHDMRLPDEPEVTQEIFEAYWIEGPTNNALKHARELGLVPAAN